tara:strand:- start:2106 stop:2684 length:579 start_codon:yes stop_codon:yes gene_type:complete
MFTFLNSIDLNLMLWIHQNFSNTSFDIFMPFITNKNNWTLPIFSLILILGFLSGKRGKIALVLLIVSLSLTDLICAQILKPYFERLRPSHINLEQINLLVSKGGKWSMPSNHAANMFSFAIILSNFYSRYKTFLIFLAIIISFSRVYVGVHFPGDVIVGGIIGYLISSSCLILWDKIKLNTIKKGKRWALFK